MDILDRKILVELDRDGRLPFSELANRTGCSLQTARNRVGKLLDSGVILKFHTAIDSASLGLEMFELYVKFRTADEKGVEQALQHLSTERAVTWVSRFEGAFDIGIALRVRKPIEFSRVVEKFISHFGSKIAKKNIQLNVAMEYLSRSYLVNQPRKGSRLKHLDEETVPLVLDKVDREILFHLGHDARIGATELSRKLSSNGIELTREAISLRINRMERNGPINGATIVLNHSALNQQHFKVLFYLNTSVFDKVDQFLQTARREPHVVYIVRTLGEWDLEFDIEVESIEQFREVLARLLRVSPELVRDYCTVEIKKIYKYSISETIRSAK